MDAEGRVNGPIDDDVRIADEEPELKTDWIESLLRTVFEVIVILIQFAITCFMLIVAFATGDNIAVSLIASKLYEYGLTLAITIGQALMVILEPAVRAGLMAWIYIQLAEAKIIATLSFLALGLTIMSFAEFFNGEGNFGLFFIKLEIGSNIIEIEKSFKWHYYKPLDVDVPHIETLYLLNSDLISLNHEGIVDSYYYEESNELDIEASDSKDEDDKVIEEKKGFYEAITLESGYLVLDIITFIALTTSDETMRIRYDVILGTLIGGIIGLIANLIFVAQVFQNYEEKYKSAIEGIYIGCFVIAASIFLGLLFTGILNKAKPNIWDSDLWKIIGGMGSIVGTVLAIIKLLIDVIEIEVTKDLFAMTLVAIAALTANKKTDNVWGLFICWTT